MDEGLSFEKKQREKLWSPIDEALIAQKKSITEWMQDEKNPEKYRTEASERMAAINREFSEELKKTYGVTKAVPLGRQTPKQSIPVQRKLWLSRIWEEKRLHKAQKKYGAEISVNSIRELRAMQDYETIREEQVTTYDETAGAYYEGADIPVSKEKLTAGSLLLDVKPDGWEEMMKRQGLTCEPDHYLRSDEIEKGLIPFLAMQKTRWFFWKKSIGLLGNEGAEEKQDAKAYNKRLMERYTKSRAGSKERTEVLDELRKKLMTFRITPEMLTDRYLADNSLSLRRFSDMARAFRVLIATNPGYLEGLNEEERIMLGNTINYTGPLIHDFLEKHQAYKHLQKRNSKTVISLNSSMDPEGKNNALMKETWEKIYAADVAEQAAVGLKNRRILALLKEQENEAGARRKRQKQLPDFAVLLKYDTTGESESRLLDMQNRMRNNTDAYALIGSDMEKLFDRTLRSMITLDTLQAKSRAIRQSMADTVKLLEKDTKNRRYSAFLEYAAEELKRIEHDRAMLSLQADQYELTLKYVTGIRFSEEDVTLPVVEEKYAEAIRSVLKDEDLTFLLQLPECRFYAKEFSELSDGAFDFKSNMKASIARSRGQEIKLHTEKLEKLEEKYKDHALKNYQIFALKPEELSKYNFDGYTDKEGRRHAGAFDLTDEVNFRHMKELESIASLNLEEAKKALKKVCTERGDSEAAEAESMRDLEAKYVLLKEHYKKWEGTYKCIKTESFKYLSQIPDMEGQNGVFSDPKVFEEYRVKLQSKLEKKQKEEPDSPDIARYRDLITLMESMMIRNGLGTEANEDVKLLNAEAYRAYRNQLRYEERRSRALKTFLYKPKDSADRARVIKKADEALFFEDQHQVLRKKYGDKLNRNLLKEELDTYLKNAKSEEERESITKTFYAEQGVAILELRNRLTPEFFTVDYIKNNFQEFASTVLTLRDFSRLMNQKAAFETMAEGLSDANRDAVSDAVDVMLHVADKMRLLLFSVFAANSVDYFTGRISYRHGLIQDLLEEMPDDPLAKKYREAVNTLRAKVKNRKDAPSLGGDDSQSLSDVRMELDLYRDAQKVLEDAKDFSSDLGEDFLDYNLTRQLQELKSFDFLPQDRKEMLFDAKSPTEELYRFLYTNKVSRDLSFAADVRWEEALQTAMKDPGGLLDDGLSKEARDVAAQMAGDRERIGDYLQWKVRQDSRVYMNEHSKALGVKESQEETNLALEIMDSIEETHTSVHNSTNRMIRRTLFPELQKKGIDPEQFMHLLRVVHRDTSGMAGRIVDISNQNVNMDKTTEYLYPETKGDFILQTTTEVMSFEISEDMLSEDYLKAPGNFRYMYFMAQKLKAYEQLYKNDREDVEKAIKDNPKFKGLLERVRRRFGTFYGNLSDHVYQMVMSFAAKHGVSANGARTFGLSPEEYEKLTTAREKRAFASESKKNLKAADEAFKTSVNEIRKRFAERNAAIEAVDALKEYQPYTVEVWLSETPRDSDIPYQQATDEQQDMDNRHALDGMEKALTLPEKTEQKGPLGKVKKMDSRFRYGDVTWFLPAGAHKRMKSNRFLAERDKNVLSLNDLFSDNPVQQMNFLLENDRLEGILEVFQRNASISASSKWDLASEDYLAKSFTRELFIDAKKMAVYALLPKIIPQLFEERFLKEAGIGEEDVKKEEDYVQAEDMIESMHEQSADVEKNANELYEKGELTEEALEAAKNLSIKLDRKAELAEMDQERRLPKLRTAEQKTKVKGLLKELKKYIGTEKQREFYKNFANNLTNYVRLCGVNVDSPENSLGSLVSGMSREKLDAALEAMRRNFTESQKALRG